MCVHIGLFTWITNKACGRSRTEEGWEAVATEGEETIELHQELR